MADEHHFEDAGHDRQQPILAILGRERGQVQFAGTALRVLSTNWTCPLFPAAGRDHTLLIGQPSQNRLDLIHAAGVRPGPTPRRGGPVKPQMPHHTRLLLGEQVLHQGHQLIADRRSHPQRTGQAAGHVEIRGSDVRIVAQLAGTHRFQLAARPAR